MNKNISKLSILLVGLFLIINSPTFAQKVDSTKTTIKKDLPAEQVEVIKLFQARLEDARKINILPEQSPPRQLEQFDYNVNIRPIELQYLDPDIKPIAMRLDKDAEKFNGFARAGYGNFNAIDASLGYNYLSRSETEINVVADFLKMNNKKERFQKFQNINANIGINHNLNELLAVGGDIGYQQKNIFFFGSPLDSIAQDTSIYGRTISKFGIGLKAFNAETNVYNLNYSFGFDYNNIQLKDENLLENNFILSLQGNKAINDNFTGYLQAIVDISSILDTATLSYNNYFVQPGISYSNDKLNVNAGVNFAFTSEKTHILPDIELSYSPIDIRIIPYIFWKGEVQKNNIQNLISVNPFLSTGIVPNLENSIHYRYGLGAKGTLSALSYDAQVNYGKVSNLILFDSKVNSQNLRQFEILKDTAMVFELKAGAEYNVNDHFSVSTDFSVYNYELSINEKPWHLPLYQIDFEVNYFLLDQKLKINPKLFLRDGIMVKNDDDIAEELNPLIDFNISAEYKIKQRFSVFGKVNNLLASEYQVWDNYSYFGLNAIVGLKAVF